MWRRSLPSPPSRSVITEGSSRVKNIKQIYRQVSKNLIDHKMLIGRHLFYFTWLQCGKRYHELNRRPQLSVKISLLSSHNSQNQGGVNCCSGTHLSNKTRSIHLLRQLVFWSCETSFIFSFSPFYNIIK